MSIIKNDYVIKNKFSRPGTVRQKTMGIIVHYTANPGGTAKNHADFFDGADGGGGRYAGAQVFVDKVQALALMPLNEVAYQANEAGCRIATLKGSLGGYNGNANVTTLGVEMCIERDGSIATETFNRTVDVVVELCRKYNLNQNNLYRHYDVTGKNCPAPWVARPADFTRFKNAVAAKLKGDTTSDKFYTYAPDHIKTLKEIGLYSDIKLSKQIKRYAKGTKLTILGVEYDGKTPRLRTAKGYVSANKANVKGYHDYIGTIKILTDNLNFYDTARWNNADGQVSAGEVFTVVKKLSSGHYLLKSGRYITANEKYVKFTAKD